MFYESKVATESAVNGKIALESIEERINLVESGKAEMYKIIFLEYSLPDLNGQIV